MSNRPDLRVNRALTLLGALQRTTADFAKHEEALLRDTRSRRGTALRKQRDATEKIENWRATQTAETTEYFAATETRIGALYEGRRERVQRLKTAGLRNLPKRAREAKERWMGDLQMRQFRAERKQTADQQAADKTLAQFTARLAEQRARFTTLDRMARKSFAGYPSFQRMLRRPRFTADGAGDEEQLCAEIETHLATAQEQLTEFRRLPLPRIFSMAPLALLIPFIFASGLALAFGLGATSTALVMAGGGAAVLIGIVCLLQYLGAGPARPSATACAQALTEASQFHAAASAAAEARNSRARARSQAEFEQTSAAIVEQWNRTDDIEADFEVAAREKIETQTPRLFGKIASFSRPKLARLAGDQAARLAEIESTTAAQTQQLTSAHDAEIAALDADEAARWTQLEAEWQSAITPLYRDLDEIRAETDARFPPWTPQLAETWTPPTEFLPATKFGHLDVDLAKTPLPQEPRLALPGPAQLSIPLALTYPDHGSLLFETQESGGPAVIGALDNIILRLLATTPPGKIAFTIIDPVGLGKNFAGLMHLADFEEALINRRIWTQRDQIEERLAELAEHIEKVIQMYLRNEYSTISEYNEKAGSVAEKYLFLVIADFPANFSESAAKRLQSIALSGPRCGIFTLIHWDQRQPLPDGFSADELRKSSICIRRENGALTLGKAQTEAGAALVFDPPPDADRSVVLTQKIGKASIDSNRVEVPFAQIAPPPGELWTGDTTSELKIAIGRTGATKLQYLAIGKGTKQHALFAGKTGSGKSTLFHVIITNLALACSPEQVEFYLIDFKKGVEFKCYAEKRLPHARVVAIESDREFALSVLQRVDDELKRRGDMFRKLGVQDVAGYKRAGGTEPMPRSLLLIDEFQEFFVDDDSIAQTASLLFDRIVRQGRAFGIHVLLGSQTLGGAYSLARATLGQMVIRVALQCNEADAYLIMDDSNSAPRLLTRPGEGIYNDSAGAVAGNSPFQVVWLPDDERDRWLDKVTALAGQRHQHFPSPIVFEGNAPADIRENDALRTVRATAATAPAVSPRAWLGAPNSIKGPTEVVFHRQSGNHLLIVGQREEAALTLLGVSLLALAAQYPRGTARFVVFNSTNPGTPDAEFLDRVIAACPQDLTVAHINDVAGAMNDLTTELKARLAGERPADAPPVFVFIHGLHKFKKLRHEDDFSFSSSDAPPSPGAQLGEIITEGSSHGMHLLVSVDTFNNVGRGMSRKALTEFEMRVVFQMSANDSASLIDSPKASNLGLHRALFYNEHEGTLETFRPYAMPDGAWLEGKG